MAHADHDPVLIHGLVLERGRLWAHAWCEIGGEITYCPTTGEFYGLPDYYRVLTPTVLDRFTPEQAAARALAEGTAGPWGPLVAGQHGLAMAEVVAALLSDYARTFPDLLGWVQRMQERDPRFARDLQELERDLLAVPDLLAALVEHPALWQGHDPGAPWPWMLRKRSGSRDGG